MPEHNQSAQMICEISNWFKFILKRKNLFYSDVGSCTHDELLASSFRYWFSESEIKLIRELDLAGLKFPLTTLHGYELQRISFLAGVPRVLLDIAAAKAIGEIYYEQFGESR